MNKKYSIMVGVLAGGLLLSTNTAEASMTTGHSQTTSNVKTSVTYNMASPYKFIYNYNLNLNNPELLQAQKLVNKLLTVKKNQPAAPEKAPVVETPAAPEKAPVVETPAAPEKAPVVETPAVPEKEPVVETPVAPEKEVAEETPVITDEKPPAQNEVKVSSVIQEVVTLTNQERAKEGLKALQIDTKLTQSAQDKSQDMKNNNYFSHTSPTYGSPFDQMKSNGITYKAAAENIAMGQRSAAEVVKAWMESPGHRANIMNASYTHIGIGLSDSGYYWTQQFIGK